MHEWVVHGHFWYKVPWLFMGSPRIRTPQSPPRDKTRLATRRCCWYYVYASNLHAMISTRYFDEFCSDLDIARSILDLLHAIATAIMLMISISIQSIPLITSMTSPCDSIDASIFYSSRVCIAVSSYVGNLETRHRQTR